MLIAPHCNIKSGKYNIGFSFFPDYFNTRCVRSFYRFALSRRLVKHDPSHVVKGPKKQKPLPQFVRENEMDRLLDIKEMWGSQYKDVRARTIIITFYSTGVRLAELIGLNTADVDFSSHQLKVTGKRNKQRIIPFGAELEKELKNYMVNL